MADESYLEALTSSFRKKSGVPTREEEAKQLKKKKKQEEQEKLRQEEEGDGSLESSITKSLTRKIRKQGVPRNE